MYATRTMVPNAQKIETANSEILKKQRTIEVITSDEIEKIKTDSVRVPKRPIVRRQARLGALALGASRGAAQT